MTKKYQIFISSTFEDLKDERRFVRDAILNIHQFPIGMEQFSAGDMSQWEVIKESIDTSDYYVLLVGKRYGSLDETGISYTEREGGGIVTRGADPSSPSPRGIDKPFFLCYHVHETA